MYAVILAGGGGTRLWPLSRRAKPKPFLPLLGGETLFQGALRRIAPLVEPSATYVVAEDRLLPLAADQAPWLTGEQLVAEPVGRNTAAAVCLAALAIDRSPDEVMAVLPADAHVGDEDGFRLALAAAARAAAAGSLVVLGVTPTSPATGYGYVVTQQQPSRAGGEARPVAAFEEKPDRGRAEQLMTEGGALWNAGIFVWRRDVLLDALERHAPQILGPLRAALVSGQSLGAVYRELPQLSIDRALLEPAAAEGVVRVVKADVGWSDLGSWNALHAALALGSSTGAKGVVSIGRLEDVGSEDVLVHSTSDRLVVTVGMRGTIVVDTPDVLLVCDTDRAQDVRAIVERLAQAKETDYL